MRLLGSYVSGFPLEPIGCANVLLIVRKGKADSSRSSFFLLSNIKHLLGQIAGRKSRGKSSFLSLNILVRVGGFAANVFAYTCHSAKTMNVAEFTGDCSLLSRYLLVQAPMQLFNTALMKKQVLI